MVMDGKTKRGGSAYAMEGGRSANGKGSAAAAGGATKFLADLPSRGLFSSTVLSSNPGGMRVYVCDHDNLPPDEQVIKTNQTNILIRSLTIKKQKNESSPKDLKINGSAQNTNGKRSAGRCPDGRTSVKRANLDSETSASPQDGSCSRSPTDFECLTVARLRVLLKERGLSTKGKKDELIARLKLDE